MQVSFTLICPYCGVEMLRSVDLSRRVALSVVTTCEPQKITQNNERGIVQENAKQENEKHYCGNEFVCRWKAEIASTAHKIED